MTAQLNGFIIIKFSEGFSKKKNNNNNKTIVVDYN